MTKTSEKNVNDGGPAFPRALAYSPTVSNQSGGWNYPPEWPAQEASGGMSLRDWFAGQAMAGLCANPDFCAKVVKWSETKGESRELRECEYVDFFSRYAIKLADAMLAAREVIQ